MVTFAANALAEIKNLRGMSKGDKLVIYYRETRRAPCRHRLPSKVPAGREKYSCAEPNRLQ
jgi:hypothetical protein